MKKLLILFLAALTWACTEQKEPSQEKKHPAAEAEAELSADSLQKRLSLVKDSVDAIWIQMAESEDQLFLDIKRLLEEVSYTKSYDAATQITLLNLVENVRKSRYLQETMTSEEIDAYDAATDTLIARTVRLVVNTPEMASHTITPQLMADIQKANSTIVHNRVRYDRWAKEFNLLLYNYKESLQQLGEPYSSFTSKPIFERQAL